MSDPRPSVASGDLGSAGRGPEDGERAPSTAGRLVTRLCVAAASVVAISTVASAHGNVGDGGPQAALGVVIGLPIVAGLVGGVLGIRRGRPGRRSEGRQRSALALGLLIVLLGSTFVIAALARDPTAATGGVAGGVLSAVWLTRREATDCAGVAHLTLGTVGAHRAIEGVAIGTLYTAGAAVGIVGAAVIAGHTALESAAVGGLHGSNRTRASGAVVFVQFGYGVGAVAGLTAAAAIPGSVTIVALSLSGGVLLVVGVAEAKRSFGVGRPRGWRAGADVRTRSGRGNG